MRDGRNIKQVDRYQECQGAVMICNEERKMGVMERKGV